MTCRLIYYIKRNYTRKVKQTYIFIWSSLRKNEKKNTFEGSSIPHAVLHCCIISFIRSYWDTASGIKYIKQPWIGRPQEDSRVDNKI